MKLLLSISIAATLCVAVTPTAIAQNCCAGSNAGAKSACPMGAMSTGANCEGHGTMESSSKVVPHVKVFAEPLQSVYDNYFIVQSALAGDSLKGVSNAAAVMAKIVQSDSGKAISSKVAEQAEKLAKATDLSSAREGFKKLSEALIEHLSAQKLATGTYLVAYCPMAKASWIQAGRTIINPYMGASMLHCGQIKS